MRGDKVADKVYALREGMKAHDQEEIEGALTNPDLRSQDPVKKAAAIKERAELEERARQLDEVDQRVVAMATGTDPSGAHGRGVQEQLTASYYDAVEHPKVEGSILERITIVAAPEANKDKRREHAHDNVTASTEVMGTGELSTETQIYRAEDKGDTKAEAALLEGIKTNEELAGVSKSFEGKYAKKMLEKPQHAIYEWGAQMAKMQGDERPLEDIEMDIARDKMDALETRIDNTREYGAKAARLPDVEDRLQHELANKQHSSALENHEKLRELAGGNAGTEDLAREQLGAMDDMLEPAKDPYGILPRQLKAGVDREEFQQIDANVTATLDVQREEKIKLANKIAAVFSTIAKLAALAVGQPELVAAIDLLAGLAQMAIKKQVAGEAYDPIDDAKMLAITAVMDLATVGVARYGGAAKAGEETAAQAAEEGLATEAAGEVVHDGAKNVAKEVGVAENELAQEAEQAVAATAQPGWKTAANLGVASAGTIATGIVQHKSPGEIFEDVLKGGLTQFLPAALGRRMQEAIGDADKARVLLGQLAGMGTELGTSYAINGSVLDAFLMTAGPRLHGLIGGEAAQPRGEAVQPTEQLKQLARGTENESSRLEEGQAPGVAAGENCIKTCARGSGVV